MKRFAAAICAFAIALLLLGAPARAQVFIVTTCGTVPAAQMTLTAGKPGALFIDINGNLCTGASVSISSVTANQGTANATPWNDNVAQIGGTAVVADPCQANAKINFTISQTANAKLISGTAAKKTYICSLLLIGADAENVSLVEGTDPHAAPAQRQ